MQINSFLELCSTNKPAVCMFCIPERWKWQQLGLSNVEVKIIGFSHTDEKKTEGRTLDHKETE